MAYELAITACGYCSGLGCSHCGGTGVMPVAAQVGTGIMTNSPAPLLPSSAAERKKIPIGTGVLDYFSAALAEVAKVSFAGNEQHNPGQPLHWARGGNPLTKRIQ